MQEETKKQAYMPEVPRPAVFGWGVGLLVIGLLLALIGAANEYDGVQLLIFGSSVAAIGMPMMLLGLLIHAIRVEGTAMRAGVLLPYPKDQSPQIAELKKERDRLKAELHTKYHGKGQ